jgi:hypothetical protein
MTSPERAAAINALLQALSDNPASRQQWVQQARKYLPETAAPRFPAPRRKGVARG